MGIQPLLRRWGTCKARQALGTTPSAALSAVIRTTAVPATDPMRQDSAEASPEQPSVTPPFQDLQFDDAKQAFKAKSTGQLLQSLAVFKACTIKPLVNNADTLLAASRRLAPYLVDHAVKHTFFRHFCGGDRVVQYLERHGIRPILNYAAEDDVKEEGEGDSCPLAAAERKLDRNLDIFMRSIRDSDNIRNRAFVAIKVTPLGPPKLLEKMSEVLTATGNPLDRGHASAALREALLPHLDPQEVVSLDALMRRLDTLCDAVVAKAGSPLDLCAAPCVVLLTGHMIVLLWPYFCMPTARMPQACVSNGNSRILVDAEHTYMQPAIDALAIRAQQRCNRSEPVVINTYQCYLKDAAARIERDMARAAEEGWVFGAKTVRGAYMVVERARAQALGYDSPIQDTLQATHANYDRCVERILGSVARSDAELMVASHNQASVENASRCMHSLGLNPSTSGVYFGQLLGMADHLSFTLGRAGYRIHKIVPYGPVHETLQYLIRRAQENSDVLGGCGKERNMIRTELLRRLRQDNALARALWRPRDTSPAAAAAA
ncbi:Proline dehydrogenase 1, mitochondrial [Coccomyxa sp. Obi]|nr:Proline dehydrogenase 1, mitochondrial [Coccomyxa sp. Obi]